MKFIYNGCVLSDLGEVSLTQKREYEGGGGGATGNEAPYRAKVQMSLKLALFERSHADNYARLEVARTALATPNAVLTWTDDDAGVTHLSQTATLLAANLPEEWGTYFQELNLEFFYYENLDTSGQNLPLTFTPAGGAALTFTQVTGWSEGGSNERFSPLRKHRKENHGRLEVKGVILGEPTASLADRRAALVAKLPALRTAMNSAEGRLTFGSGAAGVFDRPVRITDFKAEVNQAIGQIEYSFGAIFTQFPDEANYATAEATITETDNFSGEITLAIQGKIEAQDEAAARAKLAAMIAAALKQYGYAAGQQLELTATPNLISANADGDTFTELTFSGRWRRWRASNLLVTLVKTLAPTGPDSAGRPPLNFGNIRTWSDHYTAARFDEQRDQRKLATSTIEISGTLAGVATMSLAERRAALLLQQRKLKAEVNSKSVTLAYGDFGQALRVDEFKADINQAETGIDWTLRAHYTLFPNPASYATVEATFAETDNFTGEVTLVASGKIAAVNEATARAKLAAMLAVALKQYAAGANAQQVELDVTPNLISANTDGDTFTELTFTARWRYFKKTNQPATYAPTPASGVTAKAVPLGNVRAWSSHYTATRFNLLRPQRERALVELEAAGTLTSDATLSLSDRRAQLLAAAVALTAAMNSRSGTLFYGVPPTDFSQAVKVDDFKADINQAETGVDWTLKAHYTVWPNETTYAICEATAEEKDNQTGELSLTVTGKIAAATEAQARTKLGTVIAAFLAQYGYGGNAPGATTSTTQQIELNITANQIAADSDGTTFTELNFTGGWRKWKATNQGATFTKTGPGGLAQSLGNVRLWEDGYRAERFDQMRSDRRHSTGTISASGTLAGNGTQALPARRAALLNRQRALKAECNAAEGTLSYGDWSQVVRIEEFSAHVNQAETGIDWALTASYSLFPNEGGYATAEFTADVRDDVESGDQFLTFAGEIDAPNAALARAKLASLRTATLAGYGFVAGQQLRAQSSARNVSANGDATSTLPEDAEAVEGVTFLRLSFSEEYRRRMPGTVLSSQFTITSRDDASSGLLTTTYAGAVTATGATADAATAAAVLRAMALGANKELSLSPTAFLKSSSLGIDRRQTSPTVPEEFIRVSFSYEYQSKVQAGRAYLELSSNVAKDSFGPDAENVSGFIVAVDAIAANTIYQSQVRAVYATRLIRSENLTASQVQSEVPNAALTFRGQFLRLEFSFSAHLPKPAGRVTGRYAISVQRDFRSLKKTTRLRGSVYAATRAAADTFLGILAAPAGQLMSSDRDEDHDYTPELDVFVKLDFDDVYEDRLTGVSGLIEMHVTESVTYSAVRWAVQPIPFTTSGGGGVSIPQAAGQTEGSRTVRATVSAATLATAQAWAYRHRKLLTGDRAGGFYPQPEQMEVEYEFVPRIEGVALDGLNETSSKSNVQIYRVTLTLSELLPDYLPQA